MVGLALCGGGDARAAEGDAAAHLAHRDALRAELASVPKREQGPLLVAIAEDEQWLGDWTRSTETLGDAVVAFILAGDRVRELRARVALAEALTTHSLTPERAQEHWLRAARLAEDLGDVDALAVIHEGLSGWGVRTSEAADLLPHYKRAIDVFPFREDLSDDGGSLINGPDGRLWMVRKSLARYDGEFLETVRLPGDPQVRSAFFGPDGAVVGTPGGVLVAAPDGWRRLAIDGLKGSNGVVAPDPSGGIWIAGATSAGRYTGTPDLRDTLVTDATFGGPRDVLGVTADPSGRRFLVSRLGVEVFDGDRRHLLRNMVDIPDDARAVVLDADGTPWILATDGATRWVGDRVVSGFNPEDLTGNPSVRSLMRAPDGVLWMGLGRGIARVEDGVARVFRERSDRFEQVYGLAAHDDAVWFLNQQGEVGRVGQPWMVVHDRRLLPSGWIYSVLPEANGALRIATGAGIVRFDPKTLDTTYWMDDAHCYGVGVAAVALPNGWAEASDEMRCLVVMDGDSTTTFGPGTGMPDGATPTSLGVAGAEICLGTDVGLSCASRASGANGAWTLATPARFAFLGGRPVVSLVGRPDGTMFVSTQAVAWRVPPTGAPQAIAQSGANPRWLDTGAELLLSTDAGVRVYRDGALEPVPGVPAVPAQRALRTSRGLLLLAVPGQGLGVSDGTDWTTLGVADGLPSQEIYALAEDPSGTLWVGTGGSGMAEFRWPTDGASAPRPETLIVARDRAWFTDALGVPRALGVQALRAAGASSSDPGRAPAGTVYLESTAGVFTMPSAASLPIPGPDQAGWPGVSLASRTAPAAPVDDVAYASADVTVELAGVTPWRADGREDHTYRWRLDGGPWQAHGQRTSLHLSGLADGAHQLEVVAKGRWLQADATPALLKFTVDTPWPLWIWPSAFGAFVTFAAWQRPRAQRLWLRARHLRYRPIPEHRFEPSGPVVSRKELFGRDVVLRAISERASRAPIQGACVLLWADPQAGTTSLLRCVPAGKHELVVYVDLAAAPGTGAVGLLTAISEALVAALEARAGGPITLVEDSEARTPYMVGTGGETGQRSPYRPFERTMLSVRKALPEGALLLLLDHGDRLLQAAVEDEVHGSYLLPFLKHIVASTPGLLLCVALAGDRAERMRQADDLVAISTLLQLDPLDADAIRRLLERRSDGRLVVSAEVASRVFDQTGGHPRVIEAVGRSLADRMAAARRNVVTVKDVDDAAASAAGVGALFATIWGQLPARSRLALALVADGPPTTLAAVGEHARDKGAPILEEELRRVVADLVADHRLVERDGKVAFVSRQLRAWVATEHSLAIELEKNRDTIGSYQILDTLGQGGMGVVYRARDLITGRICALKLMAKHLVTNQAAKRRFLREATLLMQLRHPNIVRILARGEHDGHAYMALELLDGESLKKVIRREGGLPWRTAVLIARDVAAALEEVHTIGVVHRDVKSDNVMLSGPDRVPKLTDFGIAAGTEYTSLTQTGMLIGTYSYMSPEQVMGGEPGPGWDLYALGAMLYEMLTGELPFTGFGTMALLRAICFEPVEPPSKKRPFIPEPLDDLVVRLLVKAPEARFPDAASVKKALDELLV